VGDYSKGGDIYDPEVELKLSPDFPDIGIEPGFQGLLETMRYWIGAWGAAVHRARGRVHRTSATTR